MASKKGTTSHSKGNKKKASGGHMRKQIHESAGVSRDIYMISGFALAVILTLSNFSLCGTFGNMLSYFMFGLFGILAYCLPVCLFIAVLFYYANVGNRDAIKKMIAAGLQFVFLCVLIQLLYAGGQANVWKNFYQICAKGKTGGGLIGGAIAAALSQLIGIYGAYIITIAVILICGVILTQRSLVSVLQKGSRHAYDHAKDGIGKMREDNARRSLERGERRRQERETRSEQRREREEQARLEREEQERKNRERRKREEMERQNQERRRREEQEGQNRGRQERRKEKVVGDMREIHENPSYYSGHVEFPQEPETRQNFETKQNFETGQNFETKQDFDIKQNFETKQEPQDEQEIFRQVEEDLQREIRNMIEAPSSVPRTSNTYEEAAEEERVFKPKERIEVSKQAMDVMHRKAFSGVSAPKTEPKDVKSQAGQKPAPESPVKMKTEEEVPVDSLGQIVRNKEYQLPPLNLLKKGNLCNRDRRKVKGLSETARKLQDTLDAFGVKARVIDESRGPSVTRYELQPETGTKVSKITALTDDIKLNLAAEDIRIEAPIPGKAAVGIEVPNDTRESVFLRDLIESEELRKHPSKLAFAAGLDIAGNVIVADIAKMPHMLIAGTTGSGKSVFTNSIIMSILYRATPDEVKLIIVDPKVVEFGVYNGIPHLMTPVVTDPKKAAGALNWAVAEMQRRYQLFAKYGVRDLKGYNEKIRQMGYRDGEEELTHKEQILIVIDELADLMMVAAKEVEASICRLAQLARACGIHLIIATQRPSVDVVTGLIKANIPSRVSLLVSSGTDSRTIIDCNGGEKLLGNGDMLFCPSGSKPTRIQGAFVSDGEVSSVVQYIIEHNVEVTYDEEIGNATIQTAESQEQGDENDGQGRDVLFHEAGRFVIEKEKGSTSMLQRMFKIGFNRAARIIDQLEQAGVVGQEEGTKPRKVLMSLEEFEQI